MSTDTSTQADEPVPVLDEQVVSAIDLVVGAFGELDAWFATGVGGLEGRADAVRRLATWAGSNEVVERIPPGGDLVRLGYDDSLELARSLARRQRAVVEAHLRAEEHRMGRGWSAPEGVGSVVAAHQLVRAWVAGQA